MVSAKAMIAPMTKTGPRRPQRSRASPSLMNEGQKGETGQADADGEPVCGSIAGPMALRVPWSEIPSKPERKGRKGDEEGIPRPSFAGHGPDRDGAGGSNLRGEQTWATSRPSASPPKVVETDMARGRSGSSFCFLEGKVSQQDLFE